jgi:hypothetical protein
MTPQITTTLTFIFLMLITVPAPYVFDLNVSEVMMVEADDLKVAAEIITALQIDVEMKTQSVFTIFIHVDAAFTQLPGSVFSKLRSLTLDYTFILMKAHIVRKYFAPTLLRSVNTLCPPTLASEIMETSMYHLNISVGGTSTVTIST